MSMKRPIWTGLGVSRTLAVATAFILCSCGSTRTVQSTVDTIGPEPVAQSQFDTEDFIPMQRRSPAPLPDPPRMPPSNLIVRVAASDTLFDIADRFGVPVDSIARANLLRSYTLYPGQILNIPPY